MTAHATDSAAAAGTSSTVTATPASVPAAAASAPLIQATDLVYQGAFRLPQGQFGGSSFSYGGSALAVNSARGSLFMVGHPWQQQVAEVTIPGAGTGVLSSLPTATVLQPFVDLSEGRMLSIGTSPSTDSPMVGGLLAYRGHLYESAYLYYDGTAGQTRSHFISGLDLSVSGDVSGPYQIGNYGLVTGQNTAGFVDGYMAPIPTAWQAALGGPVLAGQCCIPIISRTSVGPSAFAIDPEQLGATAALPAQPLLYYTGGHVLPDQGGISLANVTTQMAGAVFPEGTRSILFFGRVGLGASCYGEGSSDPSLAGTLVPGQTVDTYCYDPAEASKGPHMYPYSYFVWAYDANDLAAVKQGTMAPWDVRPYSVWSLNLPFGVPDAILQGVAYDPQTGRIFVSQYHGDGGNPLIHVFNVAPGAQTGSVPPTVNVVSPAAGATVAPFTPMKVTAAASDSDGFVSSVSFYANGVMIGASTSSPYAIDWSGAPAGTYQLTATATDNQGNTSTSNAVSITASAPGGRVNVASATNGATAVASSTYSSSYGPGGAINGDRKGFPWGGNAGWNDNTSNTFPDWLEVDFSGQKTINEVDVFSLQDNYQAPIEPTTTLTFSSYGLTDFQVQYWDGIQWLVVPGGNVVGNALVWQRVNFSPLTTSRIRVWITGARDSWSRVTEIEAYEAVAANAPPTVSLTAPANNATLTAPGSVTLTASAADSDGTVSSVAFYANASLIGTATNSPYSLTWSGAAVGTYQVTAVATDNGGSTATSNTATLVVRQPNPPTVSLTSPITGASFASLAPIGITASASDTDGTVKSVAFYANGALIGSAANSPYGLGWAAAAAGTYQITAVATDNTGLTATSSAVTVVVRPPSPPAVSLTSPANGAVFAPLASITITATASDSDGTVSAVAFYANATLLGTVTNSPYKFVWSGAAAGTYQVTAIATDNTGLTSTSSAASITVNAPPARVNVASAANGATAVASSIYSANYGPSGAINGDRKGYPWGGNMGWNDSTPSTFPDWFEVDFSAQKTISEVDVFSLQDNYQAPVDPTPSMTFSSYGLTDFQVQYWNGKRWLAVPGGTVSGNTLVWRRVSFGPLTTSRIRILITGARDSWSRVVEVEAY